MVFQTILQIRNKINSNRNKPASSYFGEVDLSLPPDIQKIDEKKVKNPLLQNNRKEYEMVKDHEESQPLSELV